MVQFSRCLFSFRKVITQSRQFTITSVLSIKEHLEANLLEQEQHLNPRLLDLKLMALPLRHHTLLSIGDYINAVFDPNLLPEFWSSNFELDQICHPNFLLDFEFDSIWDA